MTLNEAAAIAAIRCETCGTVANHRPTTMTLPRRTKGWCVKCGRLTVKVWQATR